MDFKTMFRSISGSQNLGMAFSEDADGRQIPVGVARPRVQYGHGIRRAEPEGGMYFIKKPANEFKKRKSPEDEMWEEFVRFRNEKHGYAITDDDEKTEKSEKGAPSSKKENQNLQKSSLKQSTEQSKENGGGKKSKDVKAKANGQEKEGISDANLTKAIVNMKDNQGKDWDEISERLKLSKRRTKKLYSQHDKNQQKTDAESERSETSPHRARFAPKAEIANKSKKRSSPRDHRLSFSEGADLDSSELYNVEVPSTKLDKRFKPHELDLMRKLIEEKLGELWRDVADEFNDYTGRHIDPLEIAEKFSARKSAASSNKAPNKDSGKNSPKESRKKKQNDNSADWAPSRRARVEDFDYTDDDDDD